MISALVRARPELRLLWFSIAVATISSIGLSAVLWVMFDTSRSFHAARSSLAWLLTLVIATGALLWLPGARERWTSFDRTLPVSARERIRARLLATWIATLVPTVPVWIVLAVSSPTAREFAGDAFVIASAALLMFATSFALVAPSRRVIPAWGVIVAVIVAAVIVAIGFAVSALSAAIVAVVVSGAGAAVCWIREPVESDHASDHVPTSRIGVLSPRLYVAAIVTMGFWLWLACMSDQPLGFHGMWIAFIAWQLFDMVVHLLRPIRSMAHLPLDRRPLGLGAALIPLCVLIAAVPIAYPLAQLTDELSGAARVGYDNEIQPPSGAYRLTWRSAIEPIVRADGTSFVPDAEPVGFGLVRVNPYAAGKGATYEQSVAAAERMVRELYGADAPLSRIPERMLERARDGSARARSVDPVTGERDGDKFDVMFADHPRPSRRHGLVTAWLLAFLAWMYSTWAATPLRCLPRRPKFPMGGGIVLLFPALWAFSIVAILFAEIFAVVNWQVGHTLWQPATIPILVVITALHVRWILRRVERMEAVAMPRDGKVGAYGWSEGWRR